jgi:hypothetical protein
MGQRIKPDELREMLKVAHKLRQSAAMSVDPQYVSLFLKAALALEERAQQLAFHPSDLMLDDNDNDDDDDDLYRPVDFRC